MRCKCAILRNMCASFECGICIARNKNDFPHPNKYVFHILPDSRTSWRLHTRLFLVRTYAHCLRLLNDRYKKEVLRVIEMGKWVEAKPLSGGEIELMPSRRNELGRSSQVLLLCCANGGRKGKCVCVLQRNENRKNCRDLNLIYHSSR